MKKLFKIISILLIQTLLVANCAWARADHLSMESGRARNSTLSPHISINRIAFLNRYNFLHKKMLDDKQAALDLKLSKRNQFKIENDGKNKRISINTVQGELISFLIPDWNGNTVYQNWIQRQYGTKALVSHPNLILKLMMDCMLKNREILKDKVILEAGVGDSMFAGLCSKLGGELIYGIDNDSNILNIAREVIDLNHTHNIHLIKADLLKDKLHLQKKPEVLILNIGKDAEEVKQKLLREFPTLKYIFMVKNGKVSVERLDKRPKSKPKFISNISFLLESLRFKYSDEFDTDFRLPFQTEKGKLLILMVTHDKEYAYVLRKEILKDGTIQINILELNPFEKNIKNVEKDEGYYGRENSIDTHKKYREYLRLFSKTLLNQETKSPKIQKQKLSNIAINKKIRFIDFRKQNQSDSSFEKAHRINMILQGAKENFYRISRSDFNCECKAGFWPVKRPMENIFRICTSVVFIDENNDTFMGHFIVDEPNPKDEISTWVTKWKEYGYPEGKKEIRWFKEDKLFKKSTRALIINGHKNSPFSKRIKEFLVKQGLSDKFVHIVPVPKQRQINSLGLFIWPRDMLEIYYNESDKFDEKTCFQAKQYNLRTKEFNGPKIFQEEHLNPDFDITAIKIEILDNSLMNEFFKWNRDKAVRKKPWEIILDEIFTEQEEFITTHIKEIELKGEKWITKEGWKLHNEHPSRNSYSKSRRKNSWEEFVAESSINEFNLAHLLASTIGLVKQCLALGLKEEAIEHFKEGYIILRAIEIASREIKERTAISIIEDINVKEALKHSSMSSYILKKLEENKNITINRELEPGKNSHIYIGMHPKFGQVLFKVVPYEIGANYGVEERFEIAKYFGGKYNDLSPFPHALEFISFEKIERAVIVEEIIEEFGREQMKKILKNEGLDSLKEIEKKLQLIEMISLIKIWLESFYLNKYKGLVIKDIVSQDIRYVRINGQWIAKFIDLEERGVHLSFDDMLKFYSEMDYDYDPMMIVDALASFLNQEEFAEMIKRAEFSLEEKIVDFIYSYKAMVSLFGSGDWDKEFKKMKGSLEKSLGPKLKPITRKRELILGNEVKLQIKRDKNFKAAIEKGNLLIKNSISGEKLLITLIPKMVHTSGRKKPSIERKKSLIYIGDRSYRVIEEGIIDKAASRLYNFKRKDGILSIELDEIEDNPELNEFLKKKLLPNNSAEEIPKLSIYSSAVIEQSI